MDKKIKLTDIRIDGGTQSRVELDTAYVAELAESIRDMPWMLVYFDGSDYWLADGFHRYHAYLKAGVESVPVKIEKGTQRDAILKSVGANATHGKRRSNQDKRKAVLTLLQDEEWGQKSINWIAQRCAVSFHFADDLRKSTLQKRSATVETSDGRKMKTENIGKKSSPKPDPEPLEDGCSDPVEESPPPARPSASVRQSPPPSKDAEPWDEFNAMIEEIKSDYRAIARKWNELLKFQDKRPTNPYGHFMSYDGTAGHANAGVRYADDYKPVAASDKPPFFIPGHSAELRKGA